MNEEVTIEEIGDGKVQMCCSEAVFTKQDGWTYPVNCIIISLDSAFQLEEGIKALRENENPTP